MHLKTTNPQIQPDLKPTAKQSSTDISVPRLLGSQRASQGKLRVDIPHWSPLLHQFSWLLFGFFIEG